MPGTRSEPGDVLQYSMLIECPKCRMKMILHVGLTGDPKNGTLECIECHCDILPVRVPGQIVGGPFPAIN